VKIVKNSSQSDPEGVSGFWKSVKLGPALSFRLSLETSKCENNQREMLRPNGRRDHAPSCNAPRAASIYSARRTKRVFVQ
jgi:hypothetical protein